MEGGKETDVCIVSSSPDLLSPIEGSELLTNQKRSRSFQFTSSDRASQGSSKSAILGEATINLLIMLMH
ncbi:hypothetical protein LOK49_LG02G02042 [Camellia lanceoleosa]|uniref:Uncharacterized protein n=1 Tax=Camellia lanceoleosa TaxID=1840588 RepID=A0ACC0ISG6_9ERIC|nr:hypothetical protein LOK49_LG02G02042 [Camellia lanceoleosa]